MEFEHIEKRLKKLYKSLITDITLDEKKRIRQETLVAFKNKYGQTSPLISWHNLALLRFSKLAILSGLFILIVNSFLFSKTELLAGQIEPKTGTVKITRNNKIILVQEKTDIQEGDIIEIDPESEAEILFPDEFKALIKPETQLKVINRNEIFIERGKVINTSFESHQFTGNRGFVEGLPGAEFSITISESGEMEVISQKNNINVFDWNNGEMKLSSGQKINLRTDTYLEDIEIPANLNLSDRQLHSIQAKLTITRTKLITTLEKIGVAQEKEETASIDLVSIQKSFMSLMDVMNATRDMTITKRTHWENFSFEDVILTMKERNVPENFIEEARSLQTLFLLVQDQATKGTISFKIPNTQVESFNRFVILDTIFIKSNQEHRNLLKQKYVATFLQEILNEPLRIDQISILNQEISKLPHTKEAHDFLQSLQNMLPPDIADILKEKINQDFK